MLLLSLDYSGVGFFSFFKVLFYRLILFISGSSLQMGIDEIQLIVLSLLSISGGIIGSFIVLKKMTMFANAISHTILFGLVIVFAVFGAMKTEMLYLVVAAAITSVFTGCFIKLMTDVFKLREDAGIAFVFSFVFALSIIMLVVLSRNSHIGIDLVVGNPDVLDVNDIKYVSMVCISSIVFYLLFYSRLISTSFDPVYSRVSFSSDLFVNYMLMMQASLTLVGCFRSVGVLMAIAFLIIPSVIAKIFAKSVFSMIIIASIVGIMCSIIGVVLSRIILNNLKIGVSTGGLVVCILGLLYIILLPLKSFIRN